jgi:hypothetical protein
LDAAYERRFNMAKGIALTIGLDSVDPGHYEGWSGPLNACEFDAKDMAEIANKEGFKTSTLLTKAATRDAVRNAIEETGKILESGDIFMLSYSGHGGQLPDINSDEADLEDETWCLYDGELVDDELDELWVGFGQGVRILVFSDSCHSGTVIREYYRSLALGGRLYSGCTEQGENTEFRIMPAEVAIRTYRKNRELYDPILSKFKTEGLKQKQKEAVKARVRLLSGCQDNQLSSDGTFNGLFTGMLLRVWNDGRFKGNYREFHKAIVQRMPSTQTPNHFVIGQPLPSYDSERPFTI